MNKKAILIGASLKSEPENKVDEYLDELEFLAYTLDIEVIKRFKQKMQKIDPKFFLGKGKIQEIKDFIINNPVDYIIFDEQLTPSHYKNLTKEFSVEITDRTRLILEIFAQRAKTAVAKKQVELARCKYFLPFLTGRWGHLERQRGGIGLRGGPGEKALETDRRILKNRIAKLTNDLKKIGVQKQQQRKNRESIVKVAIVGYTNVGKSTILNLLAKTNVFAENKLFATLDTTVKKISFGSTSFLITDTVGFIRKLPHTLVEAFKSTLDEIIEADILLHVIDISHPQYIEQIETVENTLKEINANQEHVIYVFNKIDLYNEKLDPFDLSKPNLSIDELNKLWIAKNKKCVFISAKNRTNISELREVLLNEVNLIYMKKSLINSSNNFSQNNKDISQ